MASHAQPVALSSTAATARSKPPSWPEARSPIPALTLPPRRLLPPINTMLMVNRPGILRRYQPIPPIRRPVATFGRAERATNHPQHLFDGEWLDTFNSEPTWRCGSEDNRPTAVSSRAGYSWQRLQETIRRESRVHGITNDEGESASEDKPSFKSENNEVQHDAVPVVSGGFYWTRSRGHIPS
ncbi:hypothetical protein ON010_g17296 [Phytophthora cinnamomi]|nr:hypothetical protein ON010_g17296 [Phytophthora cinnamomi]